MIWIDKWWLKSPVLWQIQEVNLWGSQFILCKRLIIVFLLPTSIRSFPPPNGYWMSIQEKIHAFINVLMDMFPYRHWKWKYFPKWASSSFSPERKGEQSWRLFENHQFSTLCLKIFFRIWLRLLKRLFKTRLRHFTLSFFQP